MESDLSCEKIKMLLSAYFDDELSEEESNIVKNHLYNCPECLNDLNNIKNVSNYLQNFSEKIFPPINDIALKVINRIYNEKKLTCNEVLEEVSAYHDGELALKLHYLVGDHLKKCKCCRSEYENLKLISKLVKSAYAQDSETLKLNRTTDL
ncbi:MAG: zf-HC2 domain-containing protein [Candidatus Gastranaerophilales bacterium]|nr:zf-HC2 domain-containing protein [Candidatus Gastranaerophilales bacterium]